VPELREERYQSILSVPLIWRGECIGVINVRTLAPHEYNKQQVQLLSSIASQVAGSVAASRRIREANKRATHLSTVAEVSKTITSNLYLEEILQLAVAATAQTMNFKIVSLLLVDEEKQELVLKATQTQSKDYVKKPNLPVGESIAGQAITSGRVVTVKDVKTSPAYRFPEIAKREGLTSLACVPLKVRERVIGVMNCYTEKQHDFTEDEIAVLDTLGNQVAVAIENAKLMVKGALLQEMHHRVKNNLQTIASLLRLQSHYVTNQSPKEVLNESINRVLAVAAVHDLLSREDLDTISVRKIADQILTAIKQSFVDPSKRIEMRTEGPGPDARLAQGELGGVDPERSGLERRRARLQNRERGLYRGPVDRGAGQQVAARSAQRWRPSPGNFDIRKFTDLGLQIIETLTRGDLQGDFTLQTEEGVTVAAITFPR
jgi:GAF domain-containing protein